MLESEAELYIKANELIEDIFKFKKEKCQDLSIMESIIEYSYQKSIPIQELGNILADHKEYVNIFKNQLIKDGYFRDESDNLDMEYIEEEW